MQTDTPEGREAYVAALIAKRAYGITVVQRDELLASQGGRCAICDEQPKKPSVDHCHQSNRIRAILCHHCNLALGQFKDNIETLKAAINYLEKHSGAEH